MRLKLQFLIGFVCLSLGLIPSLSLAQSSGSVVINEIAWMGTRASASDEWIELYNNTDQDIDLADWSLVASDGSPQISLEGIIPKQGFFLLERTDDAVISDLIAQQIYSGSLENGGEELFLKMPVEQWLITLISGMPEIMPKNYLWKGLM